MAKCYSPKRLKPLKNAFTGGDERSNQLLPALEKAFEKAVQVNIIVSFVMESGAKAVYPSLKGAVKRGVPIRLLCGSYLNITQPSALYLLRTLLSEDVIHLYDNPDKSFHPKAYHFVFDDHEELFIGSSNLSQSGLTLGIEWNYRIDSREDFQSIADFVNAFERLWNNDSFSLKDEKLKDYAANWIRPAIYKDLEKAENKIKNSVIEPRNVQIEALYELEKTRKLGANKALIHAATGIGKTYLAAFDTKHYKRILFVAHRYEILKQAKLTFEKVYPKRSSGFYNQEEKNTNADMIFASVFSLGSQEALERGEFSKTDFDYIVIDEFHHAAAASYQRILNYFQPKFVLGLTATPERMDGKNIYALLDFNVPFELNLHQAVAQGILCPFHYYGIYDDTDYSAVRIYNNHYSTEDLNQLYLHANSRMDLIYLHFLKHSLKRALGFCSSQLHAKLMAEYFNKKGIPADYLTSQKKSSQRSEILESLKEGKIHILFCVDMLNEGLDIPSVDSVLFLRPTESPIIFLQQLGRGLRKSADKEFLTVLDFIGNYRKAEKIPSYLVPNFCLHKSGGFPVIQKFLPQDCIVDFDLQLIDLFERLSRKQATKVQRVIQEYKRISKELNKTPSRLEMYVNMDEEIYQICLNSGKNNLFRDYLSFLKEQNDLSLSLSQLYISSFYEIVQVFEQTAMSKSYKLPVLKSFLADGVLKTIVSMDEILKEWKKFYSQNQNWQDVADDYEDYKRITDKQHLANIQKNPIRFLTKSSPEIFELKGKDLILKIENIPNRLRKDLYLQLSDVLSYRTAYYYEVRLIKNRCKTVEYKN